MEVQGDGGAAFGIWVISSVHVKRRQNGTLLLINRTIQLVYCDAYIAGSLKVHQQT
ncbi:hypothetical protein E2542_SST24414 [Spatholobus suberectus]|nr:hypothetical protein E2542_SST24414 [Spatholobus suberectus]